MSNMNTVEQPHYNLAADGCELSPDSMALICRARNLEYIRQIARFPPMYQKPG